MFYRTFGHNVEKMLVAIFTKFFISKALFTQDILTHNIVIKLHGIVYCDKNIFEPLISIGQDKLLKTTNQGILCFVKSLPWLVI
jgi:hypothetical protein